jgi:hypothetical protein
MLGSKTFKNLTHGILFNLSTLPFNQVVPAWFELRSKVDVAANMLFGLRYVEDAYVGSRLMTACAALEALHRGAYDHPRWTDDEWAELKKQAFTGVEGKYKHAITVYKDLSYKSRARELLGKAAPAAVKALLGDEEIWLKLVHQARVGLAHALGDDAEMSLDLQFRLVRVTQTLMYLVLADELGLSAEAQLAFVNNNQEVLWDSIQFKKLTAPMP